MRSSGISGGGGSSRCNIIQHHDRTTTTTTTPLEGMFFRANTNRLFEEEKIKISVELNRVEWRSRWYLQNRQRISKCVADGIEYARWDEMKRSETKRLHTQTRAFASPQPSQSMEWCNDMRLTEMIGWCSHHLIHYHLLSHPLYTLSASAYEPLKSIQIVQDRIKLTHYQGETIEIDYLLVYGAAYTFMLITIDFLLFTISRFICPPTPLTH